MKKINTLLLLFTITLISAMAQSNFVVNEIRQTMSKGEQNGFEVPLVGVKSDMAKESFEKLLKKYDSKVTSSKKSIETFGDNAMFKTVSQNTVDVYSSVYPTDNGSKLIVFVDLGGAFISSAAYPQQYAAMETILRKFSKDQAISLVEEQLETEEKTFKSLNKELDGLKKNKEGYVKDIEGAKALIIQREQDIIKNDADQKAKQEQILIQQQIVETIKQKRASLNY